MKDLIGSRESLGLEFERANCDSPRMGKATIWLEGHALGNPDEEVILGTFFHSIVSLADRIENSEYNETFAEQRIESNLLEFISDFSTGAAHSLTPGESFDDFLIYAFLDGNSVVFVWKLFSDASRSYDGIIPEKQYIASITENQFHEVVKRSRLELGD